MSDKYSIGFIVPEELCTAGENSFLITDKDNEPLELSEGLIRGIINECRKVELYSDLPFFIVPTTLSTSEFLENCYNISQ